MAVAAQLGKSRKTICFIQCVVDGQLVIQGRSLEAEVVVVELNVDSDFLVEVATGADLNAVAGSQVVVRAAGGQGKASTAEEGVFLGTVGIGAAVGVVGTAIATTGRRLVCIVANAVVF